MHAARPHDPHAGSCIHQPQNLMHTPTLQINRSAQPRGISCKPPRYNHAHDRVPPPPAATSTFASQCSCPALQPYMRTRPASPPLKWIANKTRPLRTQNSNAAQTPQPHTHTHHTTINPRTSPNTAGPRSSPSPCTAPPPTSISSRGHCPPHSASGQLPP